MTRPGKARATYNSDSNKLAILAMNRDHANDQDRSNLQHTAPGIIEEIRAWLFPTQYDSAGSEYRKHLDAYTNGTGLWLGSTDQYRQWLQDDEVSLLRIEGVSGSGKSVHAARITQSLQNENPSCPVLFFFPGSRNTVVSRPQALVRDWLDQLLNYSPLLQHRLKSYIGQNFQTNPVPITTLMNHLRNAFSELRDPIFCVIDDLDELETEHDSFLQELGTLIKCRPGHVKTLVTSRPGPQVRAFLQNIPSLLLSLREDLVSLDISCYIQRITATSAIPHHQWHTIEQAVSRKAKGVFIFARLAMDALVEPDADIEALLSQLPNDLENLYSGLLKEHRRRCDVSQAIQELILEFVTHATRPLRPLELADMLQHFSPHETPGNRKDAQTMVLQACGSLLGVLADGTVTFIHDSFAEYFKSTRGGDLGQPILSSPAHGRLGRVCLAYLMASGCLDQLGRNFDRSDGTSRVNRRSMTDATLANMRSQFPFYDYAASYWVAHVRASSETSPYQDETTRLIQTFFERDEGIACWLNSHSKADAPYGGNLTVLHAAAISGLNAYIRELLKDPNQEVNLSAGWGRSPLFMAAGEGHACTVQALIESGADPNQSDHEGWSPLHEAARQNRPDVLKVLLDAGVDPSTTRELNRTRWRPFLSSEGEPTALRIACYRNRREAVEVLLSKVVQDETQHALIWAAQDCTSDTVELIINQPGVDVNFLLSGSTALHHACRRRDLRMVGALLNSGADVEKCIEEDQCKDMRGSASSLGLTALQGLCLPHTATDYRLSSSARIFDLLVDAGADVHRRNVRKKTYLHQVVEADLKDSLLIATKLLQADVAVDAKDDTGNAALHYCRSDNMLQLLVDVGKADLNARNRLDETLFSRAVYEGQHNPALKLLKMGANSQMNCDGGSLHLVLHQLPDRVAGSCNLNHGAESDGAKSLLKALLDSGADPNEKNLKGQTALMVAVDKETEIQGLLVTAGADINARDQSGETVLFKALGNPRIADVDMSGITDLEGLVSLGASVNTRDSRGRTCLHEAVSHQSRGPRMSWARFDYLVSQGLDPRAVDNDGNSLLHELAQQEDRYSWSNSATITWKRLVSEFGLRADQENHVGQRPIHSLCQKLPVILDDVRESQLAIELVAGKPTNINASDHFGMTALHIAAERSQALVKGLLGVGGDPLGKTSDGKSALHIAVCAQEVNALGLLLSHLRRQRISSNGPVPGIDMQDNDCRTAMYYAIRSGRPELVSLLFEAGADRKEAIMSYLEFEGSIAFLRGRALIPWKHEQELRYDTARVEEIMLLVFTESSLLNWDPSEANDLVLRSVDEAANSMAPHGTLDIGFTTSCMQRLLTAAGMAESEEEIETSCENRFACAYQPVSQKERSEFPHVVAGDDNRSIFLDFMRDRRYHLVCELWRQGAVFLQQPGRHARLSSNLTTLVRHGFTLLVETIGSWEAQRQVKTGQWHAFEDSTSSGLWFAGRDGLGPGRASCLPEPLLLVALERDVPNLAMMKLLVEKFRVDVNEGRQAFPLSSPSTSLSGSSMDSSAEVSGSQLDVDNRNIRLPEMAALHYAAQGQHWWHAEQAMPYLLSLPNIDIEVRIRKGELTGTPLHVALYDCHDSSSWEAGLFKHETARLLIEAGTKVNAPAVVGSIEVDCLSLAMDDLEMTRHLLRHGAAVTPQAAVFAAAGGNAAVLNELLLTGFDPDLPWTKTVVNDATGEITSLPHQEVALFIAALPSFKSSVNVYKRYAGYDVVRVLLKHGASPFSKFLSRAQTCQACNEYVQKARAYAKPTIEVPDGCREASALHEICVLDDCQSLPIFLEEGIDLNARNAEGLTVLHAACLNSRVIHQSWSKLYTSTWKDTWGPYEAQEARASKHDIRDKTLLEGLISLGADVTARDYYRRNILMALLANGKVKTWDEKAETSLSLIIKLAPQLIEQADHDGETVLMYAVRSAVEGTIEWAKPVYMLLEAGASPLCKNNAGDNILHILACDQRPHLQALLQDFVDSGVDVNEENLAGETPRLVAVRCLKTQPSRRRVT